ncbi:ABC transporter ATP-binding protein [Actinophytocola gossypii]|uniref:ABC transporter ATP-binding protein n=1 Tax=Actinophytocola gossypii TaxID=2812003 RepID=A0ABT2JGZ6_9PSEU|nr:ABC transporter ATP-binding protein [Actinophytocola gossypii]MCT2587152.1 ABC transporter ATP-binding protein [Actinophytocola gossypii]
MGEMNAVEVADLVVRYGQRTAVDGVSFEVASGSVLALLGPNGAGKTSTVEVCAGFRPPSAGRVYVLGRDPWFDHDVVIPHVGVMPQSGGVYPAVRAGAMLSLLASFAADPLDVDELGARLGLDPRARYRTMSGGEKQRLHLAMALVGRPAVAFLDEPTAGMDVGARHTTWDLIDQLRTSGVAVLLTTHLLDEAERLADEVVIMRHGQVAVAGPPAALTSAAGIDRVLVRAGAGLPVADLGLPDVTVRELAPGEYEIAGVDQDDLGGVLNAAVSWSHRHGAVLTDVRTVRPSLEDVFLAVTSRDA